MRQMRASDRRSSAATLTARQGSLRVGRRCNQMILFLTDGEDERVLQVSRAC
jgi:hypothetical protein